MQIKNTIVSFLAAIAMSLSAYAQQSLSISALTYDSHTRGPVPIPASERLLQTITAKPYFKVTAENHVLEGAIFDQSGSLLFCDVTSRSVMRLTKDIFGQSLWQRLIICVGVRFDILNHPIDSLTDNENLSPNLRSFQ